MKNLNLLGNYEDAIRDSMFTETVEIYREVKPKLNKDSSIDHIDAVPVSFTSLPVTILTTI